MSRLHKLFREGCIWKIWISWTRSQLGEERANLNTTTPVNNKIIVNMPKHYLYKIFYVQILKWSHIQVRCRVWRIRVGGEQLPTFSDFFICTLPYVESIDVAQCRFQWSRSALSDLPFTFQYRNIDKSNEKTPLLLILWDVKEYYSPHYDISVP